MECLQMVYEALSRRMPNITYDDLIPEDALFSSLASKGLGPAPCDLRVYRWVCFLSVFFFFFVPFLIDALPSDFFSPPSVQKPNGRVS